MVVSLSTCLYWDSVLHLLAANGGSPIVVYITLVFYVWLWKEHIDTERYTLFDYVGNNLWPVYWLE